MKTIAKSSLDIAPVGGKRIELPKFQPEGDPRAFRPERRGGAKRSLVTVKDEDMAGMWTLLQGGNPIFSMPVRPWSDVRPQPHDPSSGDPVRLSAPERYPGARYVRAVGGRMKRAQRKSSMPACRLNSPTQSQSLSDGGLAISEALRPCRRWNCSFCLEIEFHRRLRSLALGMSADSGLHTSYAIQAGYEQLLQTIGRVGSAS